MVRNRSKSAEMRREGYGMSMFRLRGIATRLAGLACLSLAFAAAPAVSPAQAQGVVKNTFGDWQMRCEVPAGAKAEQCALVQNVAAEDRPNIPLLVIVLKTADA